jgi:hypothetical protein
MLCLLAAEHVHDACGSLVGVLGRNQRARHRALLRTHNHLPLFASVDDNLARAALGGIGPPPDEVWAYLSMARRPWMPSSTSKCERPSEEAAARRIFGFALTNAESFNTMGTVLDKVSVYRTAFSSHRSFDLCRKQGITHQDMNNNI